MLQVPTANGTGIPPVPGTVCWMARVTVPVIWLAATKPVTAIIPPPARKTCPTEPELKTPALAVIITDPVDPEIVIAAAGVGRLLRFPVPASTHHESSAS